MVKKSAPQNLKQSTLGFSSSKRSGSGTPTSKPKAQRPVHTKIVDVDTISIPSSSDEDEQDEIETHSEAEKDKREDIAGPTPFLSQRKVPQQSQASPDKGKTKAPVLLNPRDPKWKLLYDNSMKNLGYKSSIHSKDEDKFQKILRTFDMTYEYGPCQGVSRLRRWERANEMGLNPPRELLDILLSEQATAQRIYSHSVLDQDITPINA